MVRWTGLTQNERFLKSDTLVKILVVPQIQVLPYFWDGSIDELSELWTDHRKCGEAKGKFLRFTLSGAGKPHFIQMHARIVKVKGTYNDKNFKV